MLKPPDQNNDIGDKIIRAFSQPIKSNPHTKKLKHLDSHMSLNLTPEQSEKRVIMLGFCLSLILLGACSILTSMSIYQRLQKENQKITIHNKHTESKTYTILFIISTYNIFWWFKFKIWGMQRLNFDTIWQLFYTFWRNGILLPKLFWPTVRKNCSSDQEKVLKFEAEGREFAKFLRPLEQFIQTVKGQNNFWWQNAFLTCSWRFLILDKLKPLQFKLEKIMWI